MSPAAFEAMSRSRCLPDEKRNLRCGIGTDRQGLLHLFFFRILAQFQRSPCTMPKSDFQENTVLILVRYFEGAVWAKAAHFQLAARHTGNGRISLT
jgi:hypothetical protein